MCGSFTVPPRSMPGAVGRDSDQPRDVRGPATAARRIWGASLHSIMVGAVFTHLVVIGGNPAPVLVLLTLRLVVLLLRRRKLLASVGG